MKKHTIGKTKLTFVLKINSKGLVEYMSQYVL